MTGSGHWGALRDGAKPGKKKTKQQQREDFWREHVHTSQSETHTHAIKNLYTCVRAPTKTHTHTALAHTHTHTHTPLTPLPFPELWLPPCLSFWLFLFQQSQLITPYCCRQLQTTTNLEFHYSKLFHMCFQGPGRLGWPRFRKEQPPIGTHPHPANTAELPSFFFFPLFLSVPLFLSILFRLYPSSKLPWTPLTVIVSL